MGPFSQLLKPAWSERLLDNLREIQGKRLFDRIIRIFTARFAQGAEGAEKNIFSFFPIESGQIKAVRPACGGINTVRQD